MKYTYYDNENNLVGLIPSRLLSLSNELFKNRSSKNTFLKTYTLILNKVETETRRRKNRGGKKMRYYVSLSSGYFRKSILTGYKRYLDLLIDNGFVEVYKRELDFYERKEKGIYIGLFDDPVYVESYKVDSFSKGYTIIEHPDSNDLEMKFKLNLKDSPYRQKNRNFLESIGVENIKLTSDQYGFRLYHNLSNSYKKELPKLNKSFINYDLKCSIPFQIKHYLEGKGYFKDPFLSLFKGDFYENWGREIEVEVKDRKKIKTKFNTYLNGNKHDYSPSIDEVIKSKFPLFHSLKYKGLGREMVKSETDLILNKVVGSLPIDEVLTIHDGFIVNKKDEHIVDEYINQLKVLNGFHLEKVSIE